MNHTFQIVSCIFFFTWAVTGSNLVLDSLWKPTVIDQKPSVNNLLPNYRSNVSCSVKAYSHWPLPCLSVILGSVHVKGFSKHFNPTLEIVQRE